MKLIFPSNVLNHISEYYRNEKAFWQITELVKYNILIPINSSRLPSIILYNITFDSLNVQSILIEYIELVFFMKLD